MTYLRKIGLILLAVAFPHAESQALMIDFSDVGPDLVVTVSGTLDLTGLTDITDSSISYGSYLTGESSRDELKFGTINPSVPVDFWSGNAARLPIFPGGPPVLNASTQTGDALILFSHANSSLRIFTPKTFVSGSSMSSTMTFNGTSLADIGGVNEGDLILPNDTITITANGLSAVPEPGTALPLILMSLFFLRRKRRKSGRMVRESPP